jgi:hypothetical protein
VIVWSADIVRAKESTMLETSGGERWGVWITQDKPRSLGLQQAYWWQGPRYEGDWNVAAREQAESHAASFRTIEPKWTYEVRLYAGKDVTVVRANHAQTKET